MSSFSQRELPKCCLRLTAKRLDYSCCESLLLHLLCSRSLSLREVTFFCVFPLFKTSRVDGQLPGYILLPFLRNQRKVTVTDTNNTQIENPFEERETLQAWSSSSFGFCVIFFPVYQSSSRFRGSLCPYSNDSKDWVSLSLRLTWHENVMRGGQGDSIEQQEQSRERGKEELRGKIEDSLSSFLPASLFVFLTKYKRGRKDLHFCVQDPGSLKLSQVIVSASQSHHHHHQPSFRPVKCVLSFLPLWVSFSREGNFSLTPRICQSLTVFPHQEDGLLPHSRGKVVNNHHYRQTFWSLSCLGFNGLSLGWKVFLSQSVKKHQKRDWLDDWSNNECLFPLQSSQERKDCWKERNNNKIGKSSILYLSRLLMWCVSSDLQLQTELHVVWHFCSHITLGSWKQTKAHLSFFVEK